jgi:predicted kinase
LAVLFLLQMAGAPGSGKSSLARALSHARGAVVLDADVIKSALLDAEVAWALAGAAGYEVLFALAADLLEQGRSVILDSPSHYPQIPARGLALAQATGVTYRFIECVCGDQAVLAQRLGQRTPRRSQMRGLDTPSLDAGGAMPAARRLGPHQWETYRPPDGYLVLDTTGPLENYLGEALLYLTT